MRLEARAVLRALSVAAFSAAVLTALVLGPRSVRSWLFVSGVVGIAMSVSSVVAEPREMLVALVFALPPIAALAAEGAPSWLMGPLATLLLLGAELNAWSWAAGEPYAARRMGRARLQALAGLVGGGLLASVAVSLASRLALFDQMAAVVVGSGALAALGWLLLPGRGSVPVAQGWSGEARPGE